MDRIERIAAQYGSLYPDADLQAIKLYFCLEEVGQLLQEESRQLVKSLLPDFKGWQGAILRALYVSPQHQLPQSDLGHETLIDIGEIERQLQAVEEDGLVTRAPSPSSSGSSVLSLTPAGLKICETLLPARAQMMSEIGRLFSEDEKILFNSLLARFNHQQSETSA